MYEGSTSTRWTSLLGRAIANASITTLDKQQERETTRLAATQKRLTAQYAALDALMSERQVQLNSLTNALAGLG